MIGVQFLLAIRYGALPPPMRIVGFYQSDNLAATLIAALNHATQSRNGGDKWEKQSAICAPRVATIQTLLTATVVMPS